MMTEEYYITGKNDMYMYLELLRQFEPDAVLDVGMFLKRTGAIARNIGDMGISQAIVIDGVDFAPQIEADVYRRVYDDIEAWQDFRGCFGTETDFSGVSADNHGKFKDKKYTLAFLMRCEKIISSEDLNLLFEWMSTHVENVVITGKFEDLKIDTKKWRSVANVSPLSLDECEYTIVSWG
jgi:hypothetical protein